MSRPDDWTKLEPKELQRRVQEFHKNNPSRQSAFEFGAEFLGKMLLALIGLALVLFVGLAVLVWAWRTLFGNANPLSR